MVFTVLGSNFGAFEVNFGALKPPTGAMKEFSAPLSSQGSKMEPKGPKTPFLFEAILGTVSCQRASEGPFGSTWCTILTALSANSVPNRFPTKFLLKIGDFWVSFEKVDPTKSMVFIVRIQCFMFSLSSESRCEFQFILSSMLVNLGGMCTALGVA